MKKNVCILIALFLLSAFANGKAVTDNISGNDSKEISQKQELVFSHQAGFYREPFYLSISSQNGDTVYYTLNGDLPDEKSSVYSSALRIVDRSSLSNVISKIQTSPSQTFLTYKAWEAPEKTIDKATVLRCASFRNGVRTSPVYTKTFFVLPDIYERYTMPVISLVSETKNFFDKNEGIYVPGVYFNANNPQWTGNYFCHGSAWEKPVHIEYFEKNGELVFSQDAGVRIHGGGTRAAAQKSLRLYAREKYGKKYFKCRLLPGRNVDKYKRFILRTTMGAWGAPTVIKDVLAHAIAKNLDVDYQEYSPVIVFINGEYWGIHTIRDRIDERYIEYLYNIDKDSVMFYEDNQSDFFSILKYIDSHDLADDSNYEYVKERIDIDNYIDYNIIELFLKNFDWPVGNFKIWRPIAKGGKWRWIFFDLDGALGKPRDYNMLQHATLNDSSVVWPNPPASTFLFRNLLKNRTFRSNFISRYSELLNTEFKSCTMISKLNDIEELYAPEIKSHAIRWHYPESFKKWKEAVEDELRRFLVERPCYVAENIMTFFNTDDFGFSCDSVIEKKQLDINSLLLIAPNPSDGNFYFYNNFDYILNAEIIISNVNGSIVYREENVFIPLGYLKYFNLSRLPDNIYFLRIISENLNKQFKILIFH